MYKLRSIFCHLIQKTSVEYMNIFNQVSLHIKRTLFPRLKVVINIRKYQSLTQSDKENLTGTNLWGLPGWPEFSDCSES